MQQNCKRNVNIRLASPADAAELLAIYAPYVERTGITFEYTVPTLEEFTGRVTRTLEQYPYLVAEADGELLGYAYLSRFRERAAYQFCVETSIYVKEGCHGLGLGRRLYAELERLAALQNIRNFNACITAPGQDSGGYVDGSSIAFHERLGYSMVGRFHSCGYKFGCWFDMVWMERLLPVPDGDPGEFIPFSQITSAQRAIL